MNGEKYIHTHVNTQTSFNHGKWYTAIYDQIDGTRRYNNKQISQTQKKDKYYTLFAETNEQASKQHHHYQQLNKKLYHD